MDEFEITMDDVLGTTDQPEPSTQEPLRMFILKADRQSFIMGLAVVIAHDWDEALRLINQRRMIRDYFVDRRSARLFRSQEEAVLADDDGLKSRGSWIMCYELPVPEGQFINTPHVAEAQYTSRND